MQLMHALQFRSMKTYMTNAVCMHRRALDDFEVLSEAMVKGYHECQGTGLDEIAERIVNYNQAFLRLQEKILVQQCGIFNDYYPNTPQVHARRYTI
jgi:hypothetical protein